MEEAIPEVCPLYEGYNVCAKLGLIRSDYADVFCKSKRYTECSTFSKWFWELKAGKSPRLLPKKRIEELIKRQKAELEAELEELNKIFESLEGLEDEK